MVSNGLQDVFIIYDENAKSYKVLYAKQENSMMAHIIPIESNIDDVSIAIMIKKAFNIGQDEGYKEAKKEYEIKKVFRVRDSLDKIDETYMCSSCKTELRPIIKYCPMCGGLIYKTITDIVDKQADEEVNV